MSGEDAGARGRRREAAAEASALWLRRAAEAVDAAFGEGHAARHPELVAALVQASAIESAVEAGRAAQAETLETIQRASRETNATLMKLKPRIFG
jgi:hypothetical protein